MTELEQLRKEVAALNERIALLERREASEEDKQRKALDELKRAWMEAEDAKKPLPGLPMPHYPIWRGPYLAPRFYEYGNWPPGTILC